MIEPRKRPERLGISPEMPQANLPPANLRTETSMVLVPAQVTGSSGTPVNDLRKEDFRVFEDGVEQTVTDFALEDAPVSVGFLFDSSASMRNKMHQSSKAAEAFFETANRGDEFFLVEFNERATLSVPFTTDANAVYTRVSHVRPIGRTSLLDAVHLALVEMKRARYGRKAIVIVSDGGDNRSRYTAAQIKNAMQRIRSADLFHGNLRPGGPAQPHSGGEEWARSCWMSSPKTAEAATSASTTWMTCRRSAPASARSCGASIYWDTRLPIPRATERTGTFK